MVLVTGATGILGRVITLELLKQGKVVRATKRPTSNLEEVKNSLRFYTEHHEVYFSKIEWVDTDFEDLDSLRNALYGIEEIYHCAAIVSFHPKDEKRMYQTNIDGTKNLLYIAQELQIRKFLFVSSIAVLDGVNENGMMDESSDFNSKLHHSSYAISKHFSEMEVWRASAEGMNTVIINPGIIVGSGNWKNSSGTLFSSFQKVPFSFSGGAAYVDVRDVAKISTALMDKEIFGERFIIISENKKYHEIGNKIRKKLGLKENKIIAPFWLQLGRVANAFFGWCVPVLRMVNKVNIEAISTFTPISNQKIKTQLQYEFIPIEESIDFHVKNYIQDMEKQN